jgi:HD-like signal output (HDOD) protein
MGTLADLDAALKDLIRRNTVTIPPYPAVAMRLQQLVATSSYGTHDLAKVAVTDGVVTGFVLRAANAAAVRGGTKIVSVSEAVGRLGAAEVVRIALAVSMGAEAGRRGPLATLRRRIWQEALAGALVAFHIASIRGLPAQEAFVGGLLHDVGRTVAVTCLETLLSNYADRRTLPESEWMGIVEMWHQDLGLLTAKKWGLPDVIQAIVAHHHTPERAPAQYRQLVDTVRAADAVVHLLVSRPVVSAERLGQLGCLSSQEAARLVLLIPSIGPFVVSLEELSPQVPGAEVLSQVLGAGAATSRQPVEHRPEGGFPVKVVRPTGELDGLCTRLSGTAFGVVTRERLPDNFLVQFKLAPPTGRPFDVHAFIESCGPAAEGGYEAEARLFALAGSAKEQWQALLADHSDGSLRVSSALS